MTMDQLEAMELKEMISTIKKTIQSFSERIGDPIELTQALDVADEQGVSLIHYLSALDYSEAIEFLHSYGANVNLKAKDSNLTPLVIAAARGHDKSVRTLMNLGAKILQK